MLSAGLLSPTRSLQSRDWWAPILSRTVWRFALLLVLATIFGAAAHAYAPTADRLGDVLQILLQH